ncbi:MAG: antitoxin component YwqK of YwqJK toxin-antitoxin module [Roseivirga sp.]|jgi:antitoxin component YwqK of YwqJK toxin-antitoxin module
MKKIAFITFGLCILALLIIKILSNPDKTVGSYYEDGHIELECELSGGEKNGNCIKYFPSRVIEYVEHYQNGVLQGSAEYFHENGVLHWKHIYENGELDGLVQYYDSLGNEYLNANYLKSKLNGISHLYFPNGRIMQETNYKDGEREGLLIKYFENGNVKYKSEYSNGEVVRHTEYNFEGDIVDSLIEFDVEETGNDEVVVKVLNPMFDRMSLELFKTNIERDTILERIGLYYSDDFTITVDLEKSFFKNFGLAGIILDIEKISTSNAVVKRRLEFTYPSDVNK